MADEKKFLDQAGVQYLWSQLSMEDYPNNETLIAVLNAIDQTKADKDELFNGSWNDLEDKPFDEPCFYPVDILSVDTGTSFNFKQASLELVLDRFNLYKTYKVVINGDEFIISNPTFHDASYPYIPTYRWGATNENFEDFPFYLTAAKEDFDMESGDFQFSRYNNYLSFTLPDEMYRNFEEAFHKEVKFYEEGLSKIDPKYLPEDYVTQENFDAHTHSWNELEDKPFYFVINSDQYGDTIIENVTETVDENGYKLAYADKYGFEMRLPFNIGDYLVYTVSGYVHDEEEEEVLNTSLYSSIGPAYYDGYEVFSDRVRADFNVDGRIVSVVVYNGTGYATFIELNGFEPDSEVSFGLHYAAVEYHKIDSNYLSDDIARTAYVNDQLLNKIDISTLSDYYTKTEVEQFHDEIKDYVDNEVSALVNSAPETLDTLGELAEAFQENKEVVDVLNEAIATKYSLTNPPPYPVTSVQGKTGDVNFTTETWTFTLTDGSTVTKKVLLG